MIARVVGYYVRHEHECDCPECGFPVMLGDTAYGVADDSNEGAATVEESFVEAGFCSRGCAKTWIRAQAGAAEGVQS